MLKQFLPTYLYIKRHSVTGKLYFGKTTLSHTRMLSYRGSGDYWKDHIRKHGTEHVETVWYCLFYEKEECEKFALNFSTNQNIVESKGWANFKPENGLDGGNLKGVNKGIKRSEKTKLLISEIRTGTTQSQETKDKRAKSLAGRIPWNKGIKMGNTKAKGKSWSDAKRLAYENRFLTNI